MTTALYIGLGLLVLVLLMVALIVARAVLKRPTVINVTTVTIVAFSVPIGGVRQPNLPPLPRSPFSYRNGLPRYRGGYQRDPLTPHDKARLARYMGWAN